MLRTLNVMNGADAEPPIPFLPLYGDARGLIVVDDVAYAATTRGCGDAPDGVWALDLGSKQVTAWRSSHAVAGSAGLAIGPDGTTYVATSDGQLVARESRSLAPKGAYRPGGTAFVSSPIIFEHRDRLLIAASSRDGRIRLFDSRGPTFVATSLRSRDAAFGATVLASWADTDNTRWLLESTARGGAIAAWQVAQQDSLPMLRPGWVSRGIAAPLAPVIVNGVIFVVSPAAQPSSSAVLYALDGVTGQELWNSGSAIPRLARAALSAGSSQVYVAADDGTVYAFGFPMEH
jgi:outer membrane protein assembly factor BamB